MSDYKTDQDRLMDQLAEREEYLAQQERARVKRWGELRQKNLKEQATLGIKIEIPEIPPDDWKPPS